MALDVSSEQTTAYRIPMDPVRWLWLAGALVGVVAVGAAGTALSLALPALVGDLGLSVGWQVRWAVGVAGLGMAVAVVPGAVLGDLFGHARLFLLGALGFTVASLLGATADSGGQLVVARLLQGLAAGLVLPQVIGYARAHLPRVERAVACGLFGLATVAGPVLGFGLGSVLAGDLGWRWAFWLVVPAGLVAAGAAVPLVFRRVELRVDLLALAGAVVMAAAAVGIMYPLTAQDISAWPVWYLLPLVAGGGLFAGFLALEVLRRGGRAGLAAPLVVLLATAGAAHYSTLQLYAQLVGGWSARSIAIAELPAIGGALVGAAVAVVLAVSGVRPGLAAGLGAGGLAAGAGFPLVGLSIGAGDPGIGMLAVGAGLTGAGLALVVVSLLSGPAGASPGSAGALSGSAGAWSGSAGAGRAPASAARRSAAPGAVFAALALGPPAGAALADLLTPAWAPGDDPGVLRDATSSVLGWSVGLLLAAMAVAVVLAVVAGRRAFFTRSCG